MPTRRLLIRRGAFAAATTLGLSFIKSQPAEAAAIISKQAAAYQDHPHHGDECAACCMFVPGASTRCTMIEGVISEHGWCKYWQSGPADTCS